MRRFSGEVEVGDLTNVGSYTGALSGTGAVSIAGIVSLDDVILEDATVSGVATTLFDDTACEVEFGVFVQDQCPAGGAARFDAH